MMHIKKLELIIEIFQQCVMENAKVRTDTYGNLLHNEYKVVRSIGIIANTSYFIAERM